MEENKLYIKNIFKGVIISFCATIVLFFILAVILSKTSISENIINPSIIVLSSISIFFGAGIIARKVKQKGILVGAIIGFIYMIIMMIISGIFTRDFSFNMYSIILFFASIFLGAIGGILGVNLN